MFPPVLVFFFKSLLHYPFVIPFVIITSHCWPSLKNKIQKRPHPNFTLSSIIFDSLHLILLAHISTSINLSTFLFCLLFLKKKTNPDVNNTFKNNNKKKKRFECWTGPCGHFRHLKSRSPPQPTHPTLDCSEYCARCDTQGKPQNSNVSPNPKQKSNQITCKCEPAPLS